MSTEFDSSMSAAFSGFTKGFTASFFPALATGLAIGVTQELTDPYKIMVTKDGHNQLILDSRFPQGLAKATTQEKVVHYISQGLLVSSFYFGLIASYRIRQPEVGVEEKVAHLVTTAASLALGVGLRKYSSIAIKEHMNA